MKFIVEQQELIWPIIRPLLGLKETHRCPIFETDEKWHTVVFHGVPMLSPRQADSYDLAMVQAAIFDADVMEHSVLCRPEDFQNKRTVAL